MKPLGRGGFEGPSSFFAGEPVQRIAGTGLTKRGDERWQELLELSRKPPRRIDDDQAGAGQPIGILWPQEKFGAQHLCDAGPSNALGERVGLAAGLDGIPSNVASGRPFAMRAFEVLRDF